jgi:hypothetical protein
MFVIGSIVSAGYAAGRENLPGPGFDPGKPDEIARTGRINL